MGYAGAGTVIDLTLPWDVLMHDNHRLMPRKGGRGLFQSPKYRAAKVEARRILATQYGGEPLGGPVELEAVFHVPDNVRRDCTNLGKFLCDSLTGIVIEDDRWQVLVKTTWRVAGIDRSNPRVNLYVIPLPAPGGRTE